MDQSQWVRRASQKPWSRAAQSREGENLLIRSVRVGGERKGRRGNRSRNEFRAEEPRDEAALCRQPFELAQQWTRGRGDPALSVTVGV